MERFFSSLRRKQENSRVFRRTIAFHHPISVVNNFRASKTDRTEKEKSAAFHGWAVSFNEVVVAFQLFQGGKQGWMCVSSHFQMLPEPAVSYSLFYALQLS